MVRFQSALFFPAVSSTFKPFTFPPIFNLMHFVFTRGLRLTTSFLTSMGKAAMIGVGIRLSSSYVWFAVSIFRLYVFVSV